MEARFADADFAHRAYTKIVERIIDSGVLRQSLLRNIKRLIPKLDDHLLLLWNITSRSYQETCGDR